MAGVPFNSKAANILIEGYAAKPSGRLMQTKLQGKNAAFESVLRTGMTNQEVQSNAFSNIMATLRDTYMASIGNIR